MARTKIIYLLHFDPPYVAPIGDTGRVKTAGHYLGSTAQTAEQRLAEHIAGQGSPLVRAAVAAGSRILLAGIWAGGRDEERRMKRAHHHARRCLYCSGDLALPESEHA
jgi:hypothetical protein